MGLSAYVELVSRGLTFRLFVAALEIENFTFVLARP